MTNAPVTATYRLQMQPKFTFEDAEKVIPYLAELGVSHIYLSPITTPVSGSEHGYNVVDYNRINPELTRDPGRPVEEAFDEFQQAAGRAGMGIILDFVPNHMGIESGQNPWWQDVLRNGPGSEHDRTFDIRWDEHPQGRVRVAFFGEECPDLILNGHFPLKHDEAEGYYFDYYGTHYPINDVGAAMIEASGKTLEQINQMDRKFMIEVLDAQYYEPVSWQRADAELNYRRFFTIKELAGVCMEDPQVFEASHRLLLDLAEQGKIQGVRLDHVDGMENPEAYFRMLREALAERGVGDDFYIVAEKIMAQNLSRYEGELHPERFPEEWDGLIQGTSGYDYLITANNLFIRDSEELRHAYHEALKTGAVERDGREYSGLLDYDEIMHAARVKMMDTELRAELNRQVGSLMKAVGADESERESWEVALTEITANFPVYRTYITNGGPVSAEDRHVIEMATDEARRQRPDLAPQIDRITDLMLSDDKAREEQEFIRGYQQFTGPVIAKGTEDTAFYVYNILRGAAEVGGEPGNLGMSVDTFMTLMQMRQEHAHMAMNASSTHDTKLGEGTRARNLVLSHIPQQWMDNCTGWIEQAHGAHGGDIVSGNDKYLFFQILVSAYPLELMFDIEGTDRNKVREQFIERLVGRYDGDGNLVQDGFMQKALREAKVHTSWTKLGDPEGERAYERAMYDYARSVMENDALMAEVEGFAERIARVGANVSIGQSILKMTAPGVPDTYQGSEVWNLSTVDPDNRRIPDFDRLKAQLEDVSRQAQLDQRNRALIDELADGWPDGAVKQLLTQNLLTLRRDNPDLFMHGEFVPLEVYDTAIDAKRRDVAAYARIRDGEAVIVAVPVILDDTLFRLEKDGLGFGDRLDQLEIRLPEGIVAEDVHDRLRDESLGAGQTGRIAITDRLRDLSGVVLTATIRREV